MKGNPQVIQELCRILDCTDKQLNARMYYRKIDPESITMSDIDEIVSELQHKPSIVKWIKQHHPECELNDSTICWRIRKMQEEEGLGSLYAIPLREYENLYQSILNLEVRPYNTLDSNKSWLSKGSMLNYLLEDVLPLSQALKRGIYNNEDGTLNVFKDPEFKPKVISRTAFSKLMRSRGYVLNADDRKA